MINVLDAIAALVYLKKNSAFPEDVESDPLLAEGLIGNDPGFYLTDRGRIWLEMVERTPLPVQQWIDPRASNGQVYDWKRVDASNLGEFEARATDVRFVADQGKVFAETPKPSLPALPDGFTAWGGELGTVFDKELKADVAVTVPNGIGVDAIVVVFQRNGKIRDVKGQQRFPAGSINWNWAKPLPADRIPPGQEAKAAERFKRQQAEDVIGYAVIPGEDDHLRRDLNR